MKEKLIIVMLSLLSAYYSNGQNRKATDTCIENIAFRDTFFRSIENIENFQLGKTNFGFTDGIDFLSNYVKVSTEEMLNYTKKYTNYKVFKLDKDNWLKWYEENKCSNIKICYTKPRKNYIIINRPLR